MIRECFSFIIFDYSNILRDRSRLDTLLARIFKFSKNDRIHGGRLFEGRKRGLKFAIARYYRYSDRLAISIHDLKKPGCKLLRNREKLKL